MSLTIMRLRSLLHLKFMNTLFFVSFFMNAPVLLTFKRTELCSFKNALKRLLSPSTK